MMFLVFMTGLIAGMVATLLLCVLPVFISKNRREPISKEDWKSM